MARLRLTAVPALLALTLATAACGSDSPGGGSGDTNAVPYRVAVVAAQSGPLAVYGTAYVRGINIAADQLNEDGGIDGRRVEVEVLDSQGDPTKAVSVLQEHLGSGPKPDFVFDGTTSNETLALLPIITQNQLFSCGLSITSKANDPALYPYNFHVANHAGDGPAALVANLKDAGYSRIGLLQANDAFGESAQQGLIQAFDAAGLEHVEETYDPTALDMTAPLQRLEGENPDVVVASAVGPVSPYILQSRLQAGITTPMILDQSVQVDVGSLVPPEALKGVSIFAQKINQTQPEAEQSPQLADFLKRMEEGGDIPSLLFAFAAPHDCLMMAALGAEQAGSTDAEAVSAALEDLKTPAEKPYLVFHDISYDADDHFVSATPDDYVLISPITKIVNGTWGAGGQ